MKRIAIIVLMAVALWWSPAHADEVYISDQGGSHVGAILDNYVGSVLPNNNHGAGTLLILGGKVGTGGGTNNVISRCDISDIPTGSTVTAAEMILEVNVVATGGTATLYEIHDNNNDWAEGTKVDAVEANSSCHNDHSYQDVQEWDGSPGLQTAGTDYINTSLGTVVMTSTGTKTLTLNATGRTAIEDRLATGDIEFLLRFSTYTDWQAVWLDSSESATTAERPVLHVTYTPPAAGGAPQAVIIRR